MPDIEKMLVLSTDHLSLKTIVELERQVVCKGDDDFPIPIYDKPGYGWFVPVVSDHLADMMGKLPEDLFGVLTHADSLGCGWVMFDRDADQIPDLPAYDW